MAAMIKRLGTTRSPRKLTELLEHGYFVHGEQRITKELPGGATCPDYRLWDNWEKRTYHAGASTLPTLIEAEHISIEGWSWHSNKATMAKQKHTYKVTLDIPNSQNTHDETTVQAENQQDAKRQATKQWYNGPMPGIDRYMKAQRVD